MNRIAHAQITQTLILILALSISFSLAQAQTTAFTYQGRLTESSMPANGSYDFQFKLFDALTGGTQIGATSTQTNVTVTNGVFSLTLDFGAGAFPGANLWLEISTRLAGVGGFTTLSPRRPLTSVPYAIRSLSATTASSADSLSVTCTNCVSGNQITVPLNLSGSSVSSIIFATNNGSGEGLSGFSLSGSGVRGESNGSDGVVGVAISSSQSGVYGQNSSGTGVHGFGGKNGVYGQTASSADAGVYGFNTSATGNAVWGFSATGVGTYGQSNTGIGLKGFSDSGRGIAGFSTSNDGVGGFANASGKSGVYGENPAANGTGVYGVGGGNGVYGQTGSATNAGVYGFNTSATGNGVWGFSATGTGTYGQSGTGVGLRGYSESGIGIYGTANATNGVGIKGEVSVVGTAVQAINNATSGFADGLLAVTKSQSAVGIWARNLATNGGTAGRFDGAVAINGNLTKSSGSFKIDHPLDPANKYLYHSFVESPDMMNIYNGNVTTDAGGEAEITMPEWFDALNSDFRYQLTVIGTFAQVIVAEEIKDNRFKIRTSLPNVKVSWQVTGVRQDAWAKKNRIPVEEAKPEPERGTYLHPELFNQSKEKSVEYARHPEAMKRLDEGREQMMKRQSEKPSQPKQQ